jgi:hypothetical protein
MSPTHRYQSRLFQTVRSQVNHLKDNVQLRWRRIKVAATWGAQAALLPLYTLFQTGRWGAQVLRQATAKQTLLSFVSDNEISAADQPIKNVLDAIECAALLPHGAFPTLGNALPNALSIRPIAKPKSAIAVLRKKLQTFLQPWRVSTKQLNTLSELSISASVSLQPTEQHNVVSRNIALSALPSSPTPRPVLASLRQWWAAALQPSQAREITLVQKSGVQRLSLMLTGQQPTLPILSTLTQKLRGCRTVLVAVAGAIALLPFTLALPESASAAMVPTMPAPISSPLMVERLIDPARSRRRWQAEAKLSEQSGRLSAGKVRIATQKTAAALSAQKFEGAIADWAGRFSQATAAPDPSAIEVRAVFMGYDHHPLKALLLWLDRAIAWIEAQFTKISHRLLPKLQVWIRQSWHRA